MRLKALIVTTVTTPRNPAGFQGHKQKAQKSVKKWVSAPAQFDRHDHSFSTRLQRKLGQGTGSSGQKFPPCSVCLGFEKEVGEKGQGAAGVGQAGMRECGGRGPRARAERVPPPAAHAGPSR